MISLRPYQAEDTKKIYGAWEYCQTVLHRADTGYGKCLGLGTPVMRFDGRISPVEEIQRGDLLLGPDGRPRTVLSTCSGFGDLFLVSPRKGDPFVVNEDHVLSFQKTKRSASSLDAGEIVNISVKDYLSKSDRWKHLHKAWRPGPLDFKNAVLPKDLPPYILGSWLGDGHSDKAAITSADIEVLVEWAQYAQERSMTYRGEAAGGASITYHITGGGKGKNPLINALRKEGLFKNKNEIPNKFKTASMPERLELLAGLIDTDGYYNRGSYDISGKRKGIIEDAAFIARSLGFAAYVRKIFKSCNSAEKREYWSVSILGDVDRIPCRVERKRAKPRAQKKSVLRTAIKISPIGKGEYRGFELAEDGLFLLGDFTVTHNTAVIASIVQAHVGSSCIVAHRDTIVSQLSLMLARFGVRHNLIADKKNCRQIADLHVKETGQNWYDPNARCAVASVDTLVRRKDLGAWLPTVTLAVVDEGHHVLLDNKWGKALALFTHPALKILLPTATPRRPDGKGLGRHADGVADALVLGPPMQWLMDEGYLTRYYPPIIANSHMTEALGKVGDSGDWSNVQLRSAAERSTIVGDVVETYRRINTGFYRDIPASASPRLAVVFAPEVKTATEMLEGYRRAGYKAELVTGETDTSVRRAAFNAFRTRQITVLIAVDIISEGTDLPAVEVIIMGRPTASIITYMQQFGRGLRPLWGTAEPDMAQTDTARAQRLAAIAASSKPALIFVDHVGNFLRHLPPEKPREWSLDRTGRGSNGPSDAIPQRVCLNPECAHPYERVLSECPYCCTPAPSPADRSGPDQVEGDMVMMDADVLQALLGKVAEATMSVDDYRSKLAASGLPQKFIWANAKTHAGKLSSLAALTDMMAHWGGYQRAAGYDDREIQRLFYFKFGMDVLSAQTLPAAESDALMMRIAIDAAAN